MSKKKSKDIITLLQSTLFLKKVGAESNKHGIKITGELKDYVRNKQAGYKTMEALRLQALRELELSEKRTSVLERKAYKQKNPYIRREIEQITQQYNERANRLYKYLSSKDSVRARADVRLINYLEDVTNYRDMSYEISKEYINTRITTTITAIIGNLPMDIHISSEDLKRIQELADGLGIPLTEKLQKAYDEYMAVNVGSDQFVYILEDAAAELISMDVIDTDNPSAKELYNLFNKYGLI